MVTRIIDTPHESVRLREKNLQESKLLTPHSRKDTLRSEPQTDWRNKQDKEEGEPEKDTHQGRDWISDIPNRQTEGAERKRQI